MTEADIKADICEGFTEVLMKHYRQIGDDSGTPNSVIAEFLYACLQAFDQAVIVREPYR